MSAPYPWLDNAWSSVAADRDRQPGARLVYGPKGIGKAAFAERLAGTLLCETPLQDFSPCGTCPSCHLFAQHSHPDFLEITAEIPDDETGGRKQPQIKVEAVRRVNDFAHLSAHRGGRRIILIRPAEAMNVQAANALLKILEEPPEGVFFILVADNKDRLLPTIRSRCRFLPLPLPDTDTALNYLRRHAPERPPELLPFFGGAPLIDEDTEDTALRDSLLDLLAKPGLLAVLDYAAAFDRKKKSLALFLSWLQKWLLDAGLQQQGQPARYYPQRASETARTAARLTPPQLQTVRDSVNALVPYGMHTLNVRMQIEYLLTQLLQLLAKESRDTNRQPQGTEHGG